MSSNAPWSESQVDLLDQLWNTEGRTASQCAAVLGVTRNSVIGKVHRLNFAKRQTSTTLARGRAWSDAMHAKARIRNADRRAVRLAQRVDAEPRPAAPPVVRLRPIEAEVRRGAWEALDATVPVRLEDLNHGACRWPIGEDGPFLFCGCAAAPGSSYCPSHRLKSTGRGTADERGATRSASVISQLEVKNGFRSRQAGQSL